MSVALVDKLLESFEQLDRCISTTKEVLANRPGVAPEVMQRVAQYSDIVTKQRKLAAELRCSIELQNWDEVSRRVKIINGLSAMIRDDAQEILSGAVTPTAGGKSSELLS